MDGKYYKEMTIMAYGKGKRGGGSSGSDPKSRPMQSTNNAPPSGQSALYGGKSAGSSGSDPKSYPMGSITGRPDVLKPSVAIRRGGKRGR